MKSLLGVRHSLAAAIAALLFSCANLNAQAGEISANLTFTADDEYQVYLNGERFRGNVGLPLHNPARSAPPDFFFNPAPATPVTLYDDRPNVLAVWAWDYYGGEDMLSGEVRLPDGRLVAVTSTAWKATGTPAAGNWWESGYDDSSWGQAIKLGVNDGNSFPWRSGGTPIPGIDPGAEYIWADGVARGDGLNSTAYFRLAFNVIPEPSTLPLLCLSLGTMLMLRNRPKWVKRLSGFSTTNQGEHHGKNL